MLRYIASWNTTDEMELKLTGNFNPRYWAAAIRPRSAEMIPAPAAAEKDTRVVTVICGTFDIPLSIYHLIISPNIPTTVALLLNSFFRCDENIVVSLK